MIDFAVGSNGDYYESIDELEQAASPNELDVVIRGLQKRVRIRALTFAQMEKINQLATKTGNEVDNTEFTLHTLVEGIVRPKLTISQARRLLDVNGEVVRELGEQIWTIGKISKGEFDKFVEALQKDADLTTAIEKERNASTEEAS
jgi:hypothetical protein